MIMLSEDVKKEIDHWLEKFPSDKKQSAVLQALRVTQEHAEGRHLTTELMDAVADYLDMPKVAVYEVATFYTMYNHEAVGKYEINVCDSISCFLCKSRDTVKHLENRLGIKAGETTSDGKFTLKKVGCLGACVGAPAVQVNKDYHEHMTPEKIDTLLDGLE